MLPAVYLYEDFIDVEAVAVALTLSFQSAGIKRSKLYTPQPDGLSADGYAPLSQKIFDIPVAETEAIIEPDGIGNDIWRESVPFVGIHGPILVQIGDLTCQYPKDSWKI